MLFLHLFLFTLPCFAFAPSEVMLLANANSTLDTDANAIIDWRDARTSFIAAHPTWSTTNICSLKTKNITAGNTSAGLNNEAIGIDFIHHDWDVSAIYGADVAVSLAGGDDYILQGLAAWFDADSINRWGVIKCVVILPGFPLQIASNAVVGGDLDRPDTCIVKSIDHCIAIHLRPGIETNGNLTETPKGRYSNAFRNTYYAATPWPFVPGALSNQAQWPTPGVSIAQWVTVTRLDGINIADVRLMIARATVVPSWYDYATNSYFTDACIIVDQDGTPSDGLNEAVYNYWSHSASFRAGCISLVGLAQVRWDSVGGGTAGGNPELAETRFGYLKQTTVIDCVLFYYSYGQHNSPRFGTNYLWNLDFKLRCGAPICQPESYSMFSVRDTVGRQDEQGLGNEWIKKGGTYAIGNCFESGTAVSAAPTYIIKGMCIVDNDIARVGQAAFPYLQMGVVLGDPCGTWRAPKTQSTGAAGNIWRGW